MRADQISKSSRGGPKSLILINQLWTLNFGHWTLLPRNTSVTPPYHQKVASVTARVSPETLENSHSYHRVIAGNTKKDFGDTSTGRACAPSRAVTIDGPFSARSRTAWEPS